MLTAALPGILSNPADNAAPSTPGEKRGAQISLGYRLASPSTPRSGGPDADAAHWRPLSSDRGDDSDEEIEDLGANAHPWSEQRGGDSGAANMNTLFSSVHSLSLSNTLGSAVIGQREHKAPGISFPEWHGGDAAIRKGPAGSKRRSPMTGSPEPPPKATPFLKPAKLLPSVERLRTQSLQRSQSDGDVIHTATVLGITPDKVVRPTPRAFHSTGLLTKRTGKRLSTVSLPDTPSKKSGLSHEAISATNGLVFTSSDSAYGSGVPSENESPLSSIKSAHTRTPLSESPLFPASKIATFLPLASGEMSPVSPPHPVHFARHAFFAGPARTSLLLPGVDESPGSPTDHINPSDHEMHMSMLVDNESEGSPMDEGDWFSMPDTDDRRIRSSRSASRQPSETSFNASLSDARTFSDMSDVTQREERDISMDEENWRRKSIDRRSELSLSTRSIGADAIFTPYPRFLNPDAFDFTTGTEKTDAANLHTLGDAEYFESNFVVIRPLGKGSFADAFKVQSRIDRQPYAVKKTRHPYNGHKDRAKRLGEVEVMWTVGAHPHCVQLLNAWEQRGHLYLQMELCSGGSLQSYLEEFSGDFDELKVWRTLGDIAQGLEHIHGCDVIHLDIKPANIFITKNWKLKIGDFGLATKLPVKQNVEREGDRIYIAKEILSSNYGKPADIFSLGIMTLELAANVVLPHFGEDWHKLRNGDFSAVSFGAASLVLQKMIKSMMDPNPDLRPTAAEITKHPLIGIWWAG